MVLTDTMAKLLIFFTTTQRTRLHYPTIEYAILFLTRNLGYNSYGQTVFPNKDMEVYLLIGQSNMAGRVTIETQSQITSDAILMLDKMNNWVLAKDPVHFDRTTAGVGPAISFAQTMLQVNKNSQIGLVPCAWGGSPIKVLQPGAKYFENFPYDEAIARAKIAMQKGVLKGILWHQGETDNDSKKAEVYLEKLNNLVANLRRDLKAPNLPFVAGEIGYFNKENHVNAIINKLPVPAALENTAVEFLPRI